MAKNKKLKEKTFQVGIPEGLTEDETEAWVRRALGRHLAESAQKSRSELFASFFKPEPTYPGCPKWVQ